MCEFNSLSTAFNPCQSMGNTTKCAYMRPYCVDLSTQFTEPYDERYERKGYSLARREMPAH